MENSETSFCKRDLMSVCTACSQDQQKECAFFQKATSADRCMYFVFNEFCGNLAAQSQALKAATA